MFGSDWNIVKTKEKKKLHSREFFWSLWIKGFSYAATGKRKNLEFFQLSSPVLVLYKFSSSHSLLYNKGMFHKGSTEYWPEELKSACHNVP